MCAYNLVTNTFNHNFSIVQTYWGNGSECLAGNPSQPLIYYLGGVNTNRFIEAA